MEDYEIMTKEEFERNHSDAYDCDKEFVNEGKASLKAGIRLVLRIIAIAIVLMMFLPLTFGIFRFIITITLIGFVGSIVFKALGFR